ncbi:hypothetical protein BDZ45DRAFT_32355 [Acephala macrosclerotiorum]|nr:hypothetical protein BDZ45DRAFT_32355 [Acephala macrosclerotiorum]
MILSLLLSTLALALISFTNAVDICIVPDSDTGCNEALALACCGSIASSTCCIFDVFADEGTGRLLVGTLPSGAKGQAYGIGAQCTEYLGGCGPTSASGENCCLGNYDEVAYGNWFYSSSKVKRGGGGSVKPNFVKYRTEDGGVRAVGIVEGREKDAALAMRAGNFTSLFESWPEYEGEWEWEEGE